MSYVPGIDEIHGNMKEKADAPTQVKCECVCVCLCVCRSKVDIIGSLDV